jgi:hypothetical protein
MVIFHRYVSLPKGSQRWSKMVKDPDFLVKAVLFWIDTSQFLVPECSHSFTLHHVFASTQLSFKRPKFTWNWEKLKKVQ